MEACFGKPDRYSKRKRGAFAIKFALQTCPAPLESEPILSGRVGQNAGGNHAVTPCVLAYPTGFEPAASRVGVLRSIQLGYG